MRIKPKWWAIGVIATGIIATIAFYHHKQAITFPSITVKVAPARIQAMPKIFQAVGTVESQRSISITPQVGGILKKIHFQAGDTVQAGQLLFEIDSSTFEAAQQQAQAVLDRDQAQLAFNQTDVERFKGLLKPGYISKEQFQQLQTTANTQAALVAADKAQLQQAKIQLEHTKITAPVAGKTGNMTIREGDLLVANSPIPLVVINQLDALWVDFNIPQSKLPEILSYQSQGPLVVEILNQDNTKILDKGKITFIDNTVNAQTGTILLKATVPNAAGMLWPGLMVNVKLILTTDPNAVVVPVSSIQQDQNGNFVYKIENGKAVIQRVTIDRQLDQLAIVSKGLQGNETVIITVPPNLSDGSAVQITP